MSTTTTRRPTPDQRRRIEAGTRHLFDLGPRAVAEALLELAEPADLLRVLSDYGRLTPDLLRLVRGDRFAPSVSAVPDDRRAA